MIRPGGPSKRGGGGGGRKGIHPYVIAATTVGVATAFAAGAAIYRYWSASTSPDPPPPNHHHHHASIPLRREAEGSSSSVHSKSGGIRMSGRAPKGLQEEVDEDEHRWAREHTKHRLQIRRQCILLQALPLPTTTSNKQSGHGSTSTHPASRVSPEATLDGAPAVHSQPPSEELLSYCTPSLPIIHRPSETVVGSDEECDGASSSSYEDEGYECLNREEQDEKHAERGSPSVEEDPSHTRVIPKGYDPLSSEIAPNIINKEDVGDHDDGVGIQNNVHNVHNVHDFKPYVSDVPHTPHVNGYTLAYAYDDDDDDDDDDDAGNDDSSLSHSSLPSNDGVGDMDVLHVMEEEEGYFLELVDEEESRMASSRRTLYSSLHRFDKHFAPMRTIDGSTPSSQRRQPSSLHASPSGAPESSVDGFSAMSEDHHHRDGGGSTDRGVPSTPCAAAGDGPTGGGGGGGNGAAFATDWNERFQRIMHRVRGFDWSTPLVEQYEAKLALTHLAQDFIYTSCSYGKIIISEVYLPTSMKTIRPAKRLGGLVGGDKYIVHNILFKFAVDSNGLYGSNYAASKVAGHELKGLMAYFNLNIDDLCLPLMALVDYRGFRLIAMSILPIDGSSIVYGSPDCGAHVYASNGALNAKMAQAARRLNIKEHRAGLCASASQAVWSPADLEGHVGTDGRFYLLDFSRVLPPEYPVRGIQMAHLYRLLRPEFVRNYPIPLCSDAFSGFIRAHAPSAHNDEVKAATEFLKRSLVPAFAEEFGTLVARARARGEAEAFFMRLTELVHSKGINMRYLGLLRRATDDHDARVMLLIEMCARVVKNSLRLRLREKMRVLKLPLEEPYHRLVVDYLNLVLGHSDRSEEYWATNIKRSVQAKFVECLTPTEASPEFPLKMVLNNISDESIDGKLLLFNRICKMCGLRFAAQLCNEFSAAKNSWVARGEQPLDDTDLVEMSLRVKHMNTITYSQGYLLNLKGSITWDTNPIHAQRFFKAAIEKFEEALGTDPTNGDMLCHVAEMYQRFIEGDLRGLAERHIDLDDHRAQKSLHYFQRAVEAAPSDPAILFAYAQFLDKAQKPHSAEEHYLRSLEADPSNVPCLQEYGNFLTLLGEDDIAERFYLRSSKCTERLRGGGYPAASFTLSHSHPSSPYASGFQNEIRTYSKETFESRARVFSTELLDSGESEL